MIESLHRFFIPDKYREEEMLFRKSRIFVNTVLLTTLFALFYVGNTIMFEMPHLLLQISVYAVLFFLLVLLFKYGVELNVVANLFSFLFFTSCIYDVYYTGGLSSATFPWFAMVPVVAMLLTNLRTALVWMVLSMLAMTVIGVLQMKGHFFPVEVNPSFLLILILSSQLGLVGIVFAVASVMENGYIGSMNTLGQKNKLIEEEKKRSDDLLLNILPAEIAEELKNHGRSKTKTYSMVTVMFIDFKDFTTVSEKVSGELLVEEIDYCFSAFDNILQKYKIEKIKTIGDAYITASGLPTLSHTHAFDTITAAIEVRNFMLTRKKEKEVKGEIPFEMRIGIHTGPVVAGIVGVKKFAYDIWGDAVNTAARMESSGEAGKINISGATYELVKNKFNCIHRGKITAKNKGEIDMYFVQE